MGCVVFHPTARQHPPGGGTPSCCVVFRIHADDVPAAEPNLNDVLFLVHDFKYSLLLILDFCPPQTEDDLQGHETVPNERHVYCSHGFGDW